MRRPYNDHHFWQERIEWERGCSKRSSAAASRIAAALSAVKGRNGVRVMNWECELIHV